MGFDSGNFQPSGSTTRVFCFLYEGWEKHSTSIFMVKSKNWVRQSKRIVLLCHDAFIATTQPNCQVVNFGIKGAQEVLSFNPLL
jgi:hypothetical protein